MAALPEGFVYVRDVIPDICEEMYYATPNNFVGRQIDGYNAKKAILTRKAAQDTVTQAQYYPEFENKSMLLSKGFIASRSGHSRGSTVDLTLAPLDGEETLEMGTHFDRFGPLAAHGAEGITETATRNRAYLCSLMIGAGFAPYSAEWWHYSLQDEPFPGTYFDFPVE